MTDHHLVNIILNGVTPCLHQAIVHYEDRRSRLYKWKEKLLHIDFIATKFQKKYQNVTGNSQGKKRGLEDQVRLRGRAARSEKKEAKFVAKEV